MVWYLFTARRIFAIVYLSLLLCSVQGGLLTRVLVPGPKNRITRSPGTNSSSNATGTVFDNTDGSNLENVGNIAKHNSVNIRPTIVNIEGADGDDYIPLHEITPDTDKETIYKENALVKQTTPQTDHVPDDIVPNHHPIDISLGLVPDSSNDEPNVIIKGAKHITSSEISSDKEKVDSTTDDSAVHVQVPAAHVITAPALVQALTSSSASSTTEKPKFLAALVAEETNDNFRKQIHVDENVSPRLNEVGNIFSNDNLQKQLSDSPGISPSTNEAGSIFSDAQLNSDHALQHPYPSSVPVSGASTYPQAVNALQSTDKDAKQTLYDMTKSLVFNGNIGGTMVYIPRSASATNEHQQVSTHTSPQTNGNSLTPFSSHDTGSLIAADTLSRLESRPPLIERNAQGPHSLDNSHLVNEINEELRVYQGQNTGGGEAKSNNYPFQVSAAQPMSMAPEPLNQFNQLTNQFPAYQTSPVIQQPMQLFTSPMLQPANEPVRSPQQEVQQPMYTGSYTTSQLPFTNNTNLKEPFSKIRILCIGDSLTSGYYGDRHVYHPFSLMLEHLLNTNIADEFELITKGVGGEKAHQMYDRLQKYLITEKPLDLVIILGGLNDLIKLDINVNIFDDLVRLHELCHAHGVSTVSVTIPETHMPLSRQVYANYDQFLVVWGSLNEKIRTYTSNWTIPCDLARKFPLASLTDYEKHAWWSEDFIHPTIAGYDQIGRLIYGCIVAIL